MNKSRRSILLVSVVAMLCMTLAFSGVSSAAIQLDQSTKRADSNKQQDRDTSYFEQDLPDETINKMFRSALKKGRITPGTVDALKKNKFVSVIVQLEPKPEFVSEDKLTGEEIERQRMQIADLQRVVLKAISDSQPEYVKFYATIPYFAFLGTADALRKTLGQKSVTRLLEDSSLELMLSNTIPRIGADFVHASFGTASFDANAAGQGEAVAIIDTGVEANHPFFSAVGNANRIIGEACFSTPDPWLTFFGIPSSFCPAGADFAEGPGTGAPCAILGCGHGTSVAGIAAGNAAMRRGVAPAASIVSIQVNHQTCDDPEDSTSADCLRSSDSDIIRALEWVYLKRNVFSVAAVNISLGNKERYYTSQSECNSDLSSYRAIAQNLTGAGIAIVAGSGNWGQELVDGAPLGPFTEEGITSPGCITEIISVGSTDINDNISGFSQTGQLLDLLAPGDTTGLTGIVTSNSRGRFLAFAGTSAASPHVAGAVVVLKSINASRWPTDILQVLQTSGVSVTDNRFGTNIVKPRIQLDAAVEMYKNSPLAPSQITVPFFGGRSIALRWENNSKTADHNRLSAIPVNPNASVPPLRPGATNALASDTEGNMFGLRPNSLYEVTARACNAQGRCSPESETISQSTRNTLPPPPLAFTATTVTPTSIEMTWEAAQDYVLPGGTYRGNPTDNFIIISDAREPRRYRTESLAGTARSKTFTNLRPGTGYSIGIKACNQDGCNPEPLHTIFVTTEQADSIPAAPSDLRRCGGLPQSGTGPAGRLMEVCFATGITLIWDDNSDSETHFEVEWNYLPLGSQPGRGPSSWYVDTVPQDQTQYYFSYLSPGTYNFRVRACNLVCSSDSNVLVYSNLP